jgi:hypothetical protein
MPPLFFRFPNTLEFSLCKPNLVNKMGKHKFTAGWCDHCGGEAKTLPKDEKGKFLPCPEGPEEGETNIISFIFIVFTLV